MPNPTPPDPRAVAERWKDVGPDHFVGVLARAFLASAERARLLEKQVGVLVQVCEVASDWNLDEIEVDGVMRPTHELAQAARTLLDANGDGK